jgi:transposase-like protein
MNFLLTAKRDRKAALRFLRKVIGQHDVREKITIDKCDASKSGANKEFCDRAILPGTPDRCAERSRLGLSICLRRTECL